MTILFITRKFPPSIGGMENFAFDLYTALGQEVDIKLIKWGGKNKYLPAVLPYFFLRACWVLLRGGVDVIHAQDGIMSLLGYVLSKLFRKPYTVVIHGLDITYSNTLFQKVIPKFVAKAELVFCISQAAADEACKRGVDPTKIRVIPLGITDENHRPKVAARKQLHEELDLGEDIPILLTVGRLVERKGVAWFVENVMPELVKQYPKVLYLVVGDGENKTKIETIITQKQLEKRVRLLGRVTDDKMPALYNGANVFVQPNIVVPGNMEGFGRVLLEASLCELPVVAAGIEGIKDAISEGKNGSLVPSKDVQAFIHAIGEFIHDEKHARQFGTKSRAYTLTHYEWATIAKEYIQGYESLG